MTVTPHAFDYAAAFSRNIGWVTRDEQSILRGKRIAIAGLGGVGGVHLLTLARLGIGKFVLADFDQFGIENFNRQVGATMSTLGQAKLDVLSDALRDINPEAELRRFPRGVTREDLDAFLEGVDLYVDSLDFFAFEIRQAVFAACAAKGIPSVTAAPLGMSTAVLVFMPRSMTFEEYFRFADVPPSDWPLQFLLGLAPRMMHRHYLVDPTTVDLAAQRGPSTMIACQLCAGVVGAESLKILLGRGKLRVAPSGYQFDAFTGRLATTWRPGGNRNPLQRVMRTIARSQINRMESMKNDGSGLQAYLRTAPAGATAMEQILDRARWSPSGDNSQPWRFEFLTADTALVRGFDTRDHCVYDLDGRASQISLGALLESATLAAGAIGHRLQIERLDPLDEEHPVFRLTCTPDAAMQADPLHEVLEKRSVTRAWLETRSISPTDRAALEAAVGPGIQIGWYDGARRQTFGRFLSRNGHLRLLLPEGFPVHRDVIDWGVRFSPTKIPDGALGMSFGARVMTRWAMKDWSRMRFVNSIPGGTLMPRMELDYLPAVKCGAHVALFAKKPPTHLDDYVEAGRAVQRFWLAAERAGLGHQPAVTPLVFARYARERRTFSTYSRAETVAHAISNDLDDLLGSREKSERAVWLGRIGYRAKPADPLSPRSVRMSLSELGIPPAGS